MYIIIFHKTQSMAYAFKKNFTETPDGKNIILNKIVGFEK